jgi:hypothetical protein
MKMETAREVISEYWEMLYSWSFLFSHRGLTAGRSPTAVLRIGFERAYLSCVINNFVQDAAALSLIDGGALLHSTLFCRTHAQGRLWSRLVQNDEQMHPPTCPTGSYVLDDHVESIEQNLESTR